MERIPGYKPSADKVLGDDVEFHLESVDPDNYVFFRMMMAMSSKQKARSLSKLRPRQIKWQNEVQEASPL